MKNGFKRVAVIGAGTMGHGLALLFALGGSAVRLVDVSQDRLDRAMALIRSHLSGLNLHREYDIEMEKVLQQIAPEPGLGDRISEADFIVEAIVEKADAKQALFHELGRRAGPRNDRRQHHLVHECLLPGAGRTAAASADRPLYNPPYIIPLVEIVPGPRTEPAVLGKVKDHLEGLRLTCITMKKYIPGFIINRLQRALGREIFHLIDAGVADPIEIDRAAKASLAIRLPVMGVVARYDFAGLDATWNNIQGEPIHLASGDDHSPALKRLVDAGHYGVKTGQGFFDWRGRDQKELLQERDLRLLQVRKLMKQWE